MADGTAATTSLLPPAPASPVDSSLNALANSNVRL